MLSANKIVNLMKISEGKKAAAVTSASVARSEVPPGVSTSSTFGLQSSGSALGTWGLKIADKDVEEVIWQLYPARDLPIEGRLY